MKNNQGFTFLEIICVVVILGFLCAFASVGLGNYIRLYASMKDDNVGIQQAQIAMNRLFIEVTSIDKKSGESFSLDSPESGSSATSYQFPSREGASVINNNVGFDAGSKTLTLNGSPLCTNVTAFSMQKNDPTTTLETLKYVTVRMTIEVSSRQQVLTSQMTVVDK